MKKLKYIFPLMITIPLIGLPSLILTSCSIQDIPKWFDDAFKYIHNQITNLPASIDKKFHSFLNNLKNFIAGHPDAITDTVLNTMLMVISESFISIETLNTISDFVFKQLNSNGKLTETDVDTIKDIINF